MYKKQRKRQKGVKYNTRIPKCLRMKNVLYLLVFFVLSTHFKGISQHNHEHDLFESLIHGKSVSTFWKDLDLENGPQEIRDYAEKQYQAFFKAIKNEIHTGHRWTQNQFDENYTLFKEELKEKIDTHFLGDKKKDKYIQKAANGPCTNIDFEDGDLSGWTLTRGEVDGSTSYSFINETPTGPNPHHAIVGNGVDPVTGIPTNNPQGGAFSVRLGDGTGIGAQAAKMTQTFLVDSTNFLFTYSYAVVFETPASHNDNELPYFTVRVFDSLGNSVPCGEYSAVANAVTASTYSSTVYDGTTVLYKDWESVFTNLSAYIGQNIRVEFTAGDCSLTGHYGYCYLDAFCGTAELTASNDLICTGDSALLSAPPGAGQYLWSNGATTQTTYVYAGGTYSCEITPFQGSGCSVTLSIDIDETPTPLANYSVDFLEVCQFDSITFFNNSTIPAPGLIESYIWNYGNGIQTPPDTGQITGVPNTAGTYLEHHHYYPVAGSFFTQLIVISADGCMDSTTIPVQVNQLPIVTTSPDLVLCENDSASLFAYGGQTYSWNPSVSNGVPFVPAVGNHVYTVIGTDANGCSDTAQVLVLVHPNPTVSAGPDQSICNGDSTFVSATSNGQITWSNGVMDSLYFLPALGNNLYIATAELNGCYSEDSLVIVTNPLTTVSAGNDTLICSEGMANLSATAVNGSSPTWHNNQGMFSTPNNFTSNYTPTSSEVNQGFSWVYFTAASPFGCPSASDSVRIEINHFSSTYQLQTTDITCFGYNDGTVNLTMIAPNNTPFTYGLDGMNPAANSNFSNLTPGQHYILIENSFGCDTSVQFTIVEPPLLQVQIIQVVDVVCNGADNGWMESAAMGGNGGYTYGWSNDPLLNSPLNDTLAPGNYTAYAWDQNACAAQTDTIIVEPAPLANQFNYSPILCFGDQTTLSSVPSGGVAPYSYLWENQGIDSSRLVGSGSYQVNVSDANGCMVLDSIYITQPTPLEASISNDTIVCNASSFHLSISAQGGTLPYSYAWTGTSINHDTIVYQANSPQFINCVVTDNNGCELSDSVFINLFVVQPSDFALVSSQENLCVGDSATLNYSYLNTVPQSHIYWNDCVSCPFPRVVQPNQDTSYSASLVTICFDTIVHSIPLNIFEIPDMSFELNGGEICPNTPFLLQAEGVDLDNWEFNWNLGNGTYSNQPSPIIAYNSPGTYLVTLTITNDFGCVYNSDANDTIEVLPLPIADFIVDPSTKSYLDPSFTFTNTSQLATSFEWNFGDNTFSYEVHEEHTYETHGDFYVQLIAFNDLGCTDTALRLIRVNPDFAIYIPNAFTPDADRFNPSFFVQGVGISEDDFELLIFNRWGEVIFETHDLHGKWDGTYLGQIVQDGTYPWKVQFKDLTGEAHLKVGHVAVLK